MSKVICDICGTSFPETATQCPICGSVRPADAPSVGEEGKERSSAYKHVKGGNFSKANVRKRNKAKGVVSVNVVSDMNGERKATGKSNKTLVIVAVVLLLAVIAVATYIILHYFGSSGKPEGNQTGVVESTPAASEETIPCEEIQLRIENILFESADGASQLLDVELLPADTTDAVRFRSADESIAIVSEDGLITPVGPGKTKIIVECGALRAECFVECSFADPNEETTEATEEATEESTEPSIDVNEELRLNRKDFTLDRKDATWTLYSGKIPLSAIKFSSDNEDVATFVDGVVTAVGEGKAVVTAEFNGQKVSCDVHCRFKAESDGVGGSGGNIGEDGGGAATGGSLTYHSQYGLISANDTTISVGDTLYLTVKDGAGNPVSVTFTLSGTSCTMDGNAITGATSGITIVSCVYGGTTYSCTVRVNVRVN